jgi:hypothetical protein
MVWLAIMGWLVTLWTVMRKGEDHYLVVGAVVVGGFAALYLWHPFIPPFHFYAIRRFVPTVIPGFVFFGALAAWWILIRSPKGLAIIVSIALVGFLSLFTMRANALIFAFAENKGYYVQLRQLAERLPMHELILAHGSAKWMTPLYIVFDRRIVPIDLNDESGKNAFNSWMAKQFGEGKPVYLLYEGRLQLMGLLHSKVNEVVLSRSFSESTLNPLPKAILSEQKTIGLYRITGKSQHPDYRGVTFGAERVWGVEESGFHDQEWLDSRPYRWTNGAAKLVVPIDEQHLPKALRIYLGSTGPKGTRLQIVLNGRELFNEQAPAGAWSKTFDLAHLPLGKRATIELLSGTFVPMETIEKSSDERTLGVLVEAISLLESHQPVSGGPLSDKGYHSHLRLKEKALRLRVAAGRIISLRMTVRNLGKDPWPAFKDLGGEKGSVRASRILFFPPPSV